MHARLHGQTAERMRVVQVLGREAAKAWHASDEGKKAHKAQFEAPDGENWGIGVPRVLNNF